MRYTNELKVGVIIIFAAIIFVLGVRYFEDLPVFGGTYALHTEFADVQGLIRGAMVEVSGVRVGAVDQVALSEDMREVRVDFHIDDGITIPEGSYTQITGFQALGGLRLEVVVASASNPPVAEGGFIPSNEQSMLDDITDRAPALINQVDTLLLNFNRALIGLDPAIAQADMTLEQIGGTVGRLGGQASQTLTSVDRLVASSDADLRQTLGSLRQTAAELQGVITAERGRVGEILVELQGFTGNLNAFSTDNADSLAMTVQNLNAALRRFDRNLASLEGVSSTLDTVLIKLDRGDGTLGLLLNDPDLYRSSVSAMENLNNLLIDLQTNPRRYLKELELVDIF